MQTKDVINACQVLANAGKKPTVALVKTKLSAKVPLATIVSGIKLFQSNIALSQSHGDEIDVKAIPTEASHEQSNKHTCTERITMLEKEITIMAGHITSLQAQVKALTER